jgi:hypothetical protein
MTVYVLLVWLVGTPAPLMFDAYTDRDLCEVHAQVQLAKIGGTKRAFATCPSFLVKEQGEE